MLVYIAPELYDAVEYDKKIDIYSVALILCEIVFGGPIFATISTPAQQHPKIRLRKNKFWITKGDINQNEVLAYISSPNEPGRFVKHLS
jgi:serine/threonine protein kinase